MTVSLIWAQSRDRVIGRDGGLPWRIPEDLHQFTARTRGHVVVMGRATWESLPDSYRPLPDRRNVVLTRTPGWSAPGAEVAADLRTALALAEDVWVIGGGAVYRDALPLADRAVVTEVDLDVEGDTLAPDLGPGWSRLDVEPAEGWTTSRTGIRFRVVTWERPG
ncbi:dihydrofolate reductase [Kineococcus gynurae]|uniref:Dihydrofolate reductase n=1 Tax=Kineococcus gynurae TaxID=452979 RepID=A0ABV5LT53_9ACTN